jgi:acyl-coenzyme A synthetase/AMP-(fatty) acid ligase
MPTSRKPRSTCAFIALHARERPAATAIDGPGGRTSYRDLALLIVQARDVLIAAGIERGQVLGVVIPDRRTHLIVLLAAEALGVTTISLSVAELGPPAHLDRLCHRVLALEPIAAGDPSKHLLIPPEALVRAAGDRPLDALSYRPEPDALVRLIKTSGTTGLPKVMGMTHRVQELTLKRNLQHAAPRILPHPDYLCIYSFSVRGAHSRALLTLQCGGTVYLTGGDVIGDLIAAGIGNFALFVTGDLERFVRLPRQDLFRPALHIDVIGSAVSARLRQALEAKITPHVAVTYGTNEVHHVSIVDAENLGTLFPGVRIRIVDENGKRVAQGGCGLIHIRTETMTSGYIGAPELTKAAFVNGWYVTNDIGYQPTPDTLVVLGRADDMINIGGLKVAPGPIEAQLKSIPGVRDALVVSVDDQLDTNVMLVAVEIEQSRMSGNLREQVARIANRYVSIFQFLPLTVFPRTETGKIQREAVKALYRENASRMWGSG